MTPHNVDLSALISTRICHDLISPIGAINNGLELLEAVGTQKSPELNLVNDSASAASAKLNAFRLAFGDTSRTSEVKAEHVAKLVRDMYGDSRMVVELQTQDMGFPRIEAKLALLLLFCIEGALPLGGTCTITASSTAWSFKATGGKLNIRQRLWDMMLGTARMEDVPASDVHFLVAHLTSAEAEKTIKLHHTETEIIVMIT